MSQTEIPEVQKKKVKMNCLSAIDTVVMVPKAISNSKIKKKSYLPLTIRLDILPLPMLGFQLKKSNLGPGGPQDTTLTDSCPPPPPNPPTEGSDML